MTSRTPPDNAVPPAAHPQAAPVRVTSAAVLKGALEIEHRGTLYRLRETKLGKLILTK